MSKLGRFVPVAVAATLAAAAACGGDSTGNGPVAASVTGIAGDSQSGPTGATLPFPLSFVALGSNGQPAQGVHVTWSVIPSGSASFNPATSTTDASGAASTSATLGSFGGGINIHAALPGVRRRPLSVHKGVHGGADRHRDPLFRRLRARHPVLL